MMIDKQVVNFCRLIVFIFLFNTLNGQDTEFYLFTKLSLNPLDTVVLEKIERRSKDDNWRELFCMLNSNCQLGRTERVHEILLNLTDYNFELAEIKKNLNNRNVLIENCTNNNSGIVQIYSDRLAETRKRIEADTVCMMIEKMYEIDQLSRKIYRLNNKYFDGPEIDSINLSVIETWLEGEEINSKRLGYSNEKKLFVMLLHGVRHIDKNRFQKIDDALRMLVLEDQFNAIFYANIVDERLRVNNSSEYPKYNFLRNIELSKEKTRVVTENRIKINAFK